MNRKDAIKIVESKSGFLTEKSKEKLLNKINEEIKDELRKESEEKDKQINELISDLTTNGYDLEIICNIVLTSIFQKYIV